MRKCRLGATLPARSWSPQFRVSRERSSQNTKLGAQNTTVVTYWPTPKNPSRQECLRHYWHADMACLLDAWPWVVAWTAERKPLAIQDNGKEARFTPDFEVVERGRAYALRLIRGDDTDEARPRARRRALQERYREFGSDLEFLTRDDVLRHPHLPLAKDLFFFRYHDWPDDLPRRATLVTDSEHPETLGDLHRCLGPERVTWGQLLSLVANGHIEVDLDGGLKPSAVLLACRVRGYGA